MVFPWFSLSKFGMVRVAVAAGGHITISGSLLDHKAESSRSYPLVMTNSLLYLSISIINMVFK